MVLLPSIFGPVGLFSHIFMAPERLILSAIFLIPLIILYLIKPKPQNVAIPSLMFIFKDMGKSNIHRFFRTLVQDILFLLQLIAILLLALAIARPFLNVSQESIVDSTIVVIDDSASMRAHGDDRLDRAVSAAQDRLSSSNMIIAAHYNPQFVDVSGEIKLSAGDAKDALDDLEPTDMPGDLPTALDLASQQAGPTTKVVIISDFVLSSFENPELIKARIKVLRSKGAIVEIVPIEAQGENIGIVDAKLSANSAEVELKIQNFNSNPEEFGLEYNGDAIELPQNVLAPAGSPGSLLVVNVPIGNGKSEIELTPKDDFAIDNVYYVSIPEKSAIRVLVISNDESASQSRIIPALTAAGDQFTRIDIEYASPPKVPDPEHDVYIIKDVDAQFLLPGVIKNIEESVENGAVLVVMAQHGLFSMDFGEALPVTYKAEEQLGGRQEIIVNSSLSFMKGLSDIGQVDGSQLLRVGSAENTAIYASVTTNDGMEPVIAAKRIGKGAVIYYGIMDRRQADIDPQSYAVIWGRIVDFSLTAPSDINIQTGSILTSAARIQTPMGRRDPPVLATQSGFYTVGPQTIAANLYGLHATSALETALGALLESDIARPEVIETDDASVGGESESEAKVPREFSTWFIIAGIAMLFLELLYVKYRGDL